MMRLLGAMDLGKILIALGVLFVLAGISIHLGWRLPLRLGRLPGDIQIRRGNFSFYFPITTCVLLSVILTVVLSLFRR